MYSINEQTQTTSASFIEVGIQENVSITDIAVEDMKKDGTGGKVLRFHFENKVGETFTHTEFEPKENVMGGSFKAKRDPKKQYEQDVQATMSRFKHLLVAFIPADKVVIKDAKSWTDLLTKIVKVCGAAYEGRLFRLKLVLNSKDYPTFPRFVREGFIEPMEIEKTAMKFDAKYDRLVPKQASNEDELGMGTTDEVADEFAPDSATDTDGQLAQNTFAEAQFDAFDDLVSEQTDSFQQAAEDDEPF
ncbi:MAG TPA: hypothetical protein DCL77_02025 [Prolixibacteraceae bacterium]|jgi:hypothetical protein|nr:hypothetical protein [Prolixibacteraceae bacterium]